MLHFEVLLKDQGLLPDDEIVDVIRLDDMTSIEGLTDYLEDIVRFDGPVLIVYGDGQEVIVKFKRDENLE